MIWLGRIVWSLVVLAAFASQAFANESEAEDATYQSIPAMRRLHLSASVGRPLAMVGELNAEYNVAGKSAIGLSVTGGLATVVSQDMQGDFSSGTALCVGVHGQYHYYLKSFERGLFVGSEAAYAWVDRDTDTTIAASLEGLWLGPKLGYKHTFKSGLLIAGSFGTLFKVYEPDGIDEDQLPGDGIDNGFLVDLLLVGPALLSPNLTVGWAL